MRMYRRHLAAVVVTVAAMVAGCAPAARPQEATSAPAATGTPAAAASPTPASPGQAFVEGYHAYQRHDLALAIDRMGYAAEHFPPLGDYALYYLGLAERDHGDLLAAAATLERMGRNYPQSVVAAPAEAALADVYLRLTRAADAAAAATHAISIAADSDTEQSARMTLARALAAQGRPREAYNELQTLREKYPRGGHDRDAREMAYAILAANPTAAEINTVGYHRDEAALLLRERQSGLALREISAALALSPPPSIVAELTFMKATALRSEPARAEAAYREYLRLAPKGPSASAALEALALIYWRQDDRARARAMFTRLVEQFPGGHRAPGAMLRIGRIYEEDRKLDSARAQYLRVAARYPASEAALDARFRAPWMLYMTGRYAEAASGFASMRVHAHRDGGWRDMFGYWQARALEKSGDRDAARRLYEEVAGSIDSNYYPALAHRRVSAPAPELPAASAPDLRFDSAVVAGGTAAFHLTRVMAMRELGLKDLQAGELRQLEKNVGDEPELRALVIAGFQSAGAYYDAIVAASRMEKRGEISHAIAERVRYPHAFWDLIESSAAKNGLDPYLVLALTRQESWFNPRATSVSDARGLMQLMPDTAERVARQSGTAVQAASLYDPVLNVELGTAYLKELLAMFGADEIRAVAAYNGGEHAVQSWSAKFPGPDDEWVENIGYRETRDYVKRVIGGMREYRLLYPSAPPKSPAAPVTQSSG